MAFERKNLAVLAYANGFTLWHYVTTADAKATLDTAGYFNAASDMLRVNDMLLVNASDGNGVLAVNSNTGGVVDCGDILAVGAADTD